MDLDFRTIIFDFLEHKFPPSFEGQIPMDKDEDTQIRNLYPPSFAYGMVTHH